MEAALSEVGGLDNSLSASSQNVVHIDQIRDTPTGYRNPEPVKEH
jgi:hypothetical protein